jgi:hypothetical protein
VGAKKRVGWGKDWALLSVALFLDLIMALEGSQDEGCDWPAGLDSPSV